jgi:putative membrane protein
MGIRTWGLAVTTLAMSLGGGASADTGSFGDWAVVCDNVRNCTAMGFGELGETGSSALIKVSREAVPDAEPVISLITAGTRAAALRLVVDGTAPQGLSTVAATPIQDDPERRMSQLTSVQSRALLSVLANGRTLSLMEGQNPAAAISLGGVLVGLAAPLALSLNSSTSLVEIIIWGVSTVMVQLLVFRLVDLLLRGLPQRIQEGEVAAAALLVGAKLATALILAAAVAT